MGHCCTLSSFICNFIVLPHDETNLMVYSATNQYILILNLFIIAMSFLVYKYLTK